MQPVLQFAVESSKERHLSGEGKAAVVPPRTGDEDELKVATPLVTSSPKHQHEAAHTDGDLEEEIHVDDEGLDNIDDIVASVKSTSTRSTRSTAPMDHSTGNLLSAFSVSNVVCLITILSCNNLSHVP